MTNLTADQWLDRYTQQYPELPPLLDRAAKHAPPNKRSIERYQAAALYALAKPYDGQPILEIGTALGYSAAVLAEACPNSPITTLNPAPHEVEQAVVNLKSYPNVTIRQMTSWDFMVSYREKPFAFIFVDGDHKRVQSDLPWWDKLAPGGLIFFHDYSPAGTPRACPPVYHAVATMAGKLGKDEPDVLVIDNTGVGMAGFVKPEQKAVTLGKEQYLISTASQYSLLAYDQLQALYRLAQTVADLPGDVVECGCGNGGSAALLWLGARRKAKPLDRTLWLFDTFAGMPRPGDNDPPKAMLKWASGNWCKASETEMRECFAMLKISGEFTAVAAAGLFADSFARHFDDVASIAILHVDATLYASTKLALETWYPKVVSGGLVIVSAYGHWAGVRKAVDEVLPGAKWQPLDSEVNVWLSKS